MICMYVCVYIAQNLSDKQCLLLKCYNKLFYFLFCGDSFHRNEIMAAAIHEYTDWERPIQVRIFLSSLHEIKYKELLPFYINVE